MHHDTLQTTTRHEPPSASTPSATLQGGAHASGLPDYDAAPSSSSLHHTTSGSHGNASDTDPQLASSLQATSLDNDTSSSDICDAPPLTEAERNEWQKGLAEGFKIGLKTVPPFCSLQDIKHHLVLLNLFDRLRKAVRNGTEYFDYPSCQQEQDAHIDVPGVDAPPPPYAPATDAPPVTDPKSSHSNGIDSSSHVNGSHHDEDEAEMSQPLLEERRWHIFLERAAYRLELWFARILQPEYKSLNTKVFTEKVALDMPDHILPPLDVAMMLHTYYLNPLNKREDSIRLRNRDGLSCFHYPLRQLAQRAHPTLPILNDVETAQTHWNAEITSSRSKQPWDLALQPPTAYPTNAQESYGGTTFGLKIACPRCQQAQYLPWTGSGTRPDQLGLGEIGWKRTCTNRAGGCQQTISAQHLQMRRFLQDYQSWRTSSGQATKDSRTGTVSRPFFMAGTLMNPLNGELTNNDSFGEEIFCPILRNERPDASSRLISREAKNPTTDLVEIQSQAEECDYHLPTFKKWLEQKSFGPTIVTKIQSPDLESRIKARIAVLMRPYENGNSPAYGEGLFDIVSSVQRQIMFNQDIQNLGWSSYSHLNRLSSTDCLDHVLTRALLRYHKWLHLHTSTYNALAPTLDIDLAWHTHQLKQSYVQDTLKNVDRFINHDDAIETSVLKEHFDRTSAIWKERYHQPYSFCGCVCNNSSAIKRIKSIFGSSSGGASEKKDDSNSSNVNANNADEAANTSSSSWKSRMKGKFRSSASREDTINDNVDAKRRNGDREREREEKDANNWQNQTHPSAHNAVIVQEEEHKHDKLRQEMVKDWTSGKRRQGHESPFVLGYNTPGSGSSSSLSASEYSTLHHARYVSRGSSGDSAINAYNLYGAYGLMAVSAASSLPMGYGTMGMMSAGYGGAGAC